ncbi:hypothetical protein [Caulobacter sp.]|uniref:hypothetical protein n=1 Tax=Caulobacter sp. TaxID=78 RepID=UPI003BAAF311
MKNRNFILGLALASALTNASLAHAEDTPDPNAAVKARTEQLKAETDYTNAQTAKIKARADALNLPATKGETKLGETAGVLEAAMLSAAAANAVADAIAARIKTDSTIILVANAETVNLSLPVSLAAYMDDLAGAATRTSANACAPATKAEVGTRSLAAIAPVLGAVIGALKVDTEVQGVSVSLNDRVLVNALAARLATSSRAVIVPSEATRITRQTSPAPGSLAASWAGLKSAQTRLSDCRAAVAGQKQTDATKASVANLDRGLAQIDAFTGEVSKVSLGAPSLLARAYQMEAMSAGNPLVLRVGLDHVGGSLVKRNTVWTAVGFNSITLTGGIVAGYLLSDPSNGKVLASGELICRTAHTTMKAVHSGKIAVAGCDVTTKEMAASR